jgi:UDP-N-acetylglucosamine--N-acetylmuramyl-(pentapeptide) pyrophosphoryl-undecaprenol N-acetylglucosamine transferase
MHLLGWVRERGAGLPPIDDTLWFVSGRPVEADVLASLDSSIPVARVELPIEPRDGGAPSRGRLMWRTAPAVARARRALREHQSQVLLGLGGFTSLPAVLAARSLRIPVALLEVNSRPGAATRWLAPLADRVLHVWSGTLEEAQGKRGPVDRHVRTGAPLGPEFLAGPSTPEERSRARVELGLDPGHPLVLVLGGSQGAGPLNAFVREHAQGLVGAGLQILHQTGSGRLREGCEELSGTQTVGYLSRVDRALQAATVVLCRGGASTLAEVAALRCPAYVVPYPHHRDQHQEHNARQLGRGARIVPETELSVELRDELIRICRPDAEAERCSMRDALERATPPGDKSGAERMYRELCSLVSTT